MILGISDSHNSSAAAIAPDGTLRALQEERPAHVKNYFGTPKGAISYLLKELDAKPSDFQEVAIANLVPFAPRTAKQTKAGFRQAGTWQGRLRNLLRHTPLYDYAAKRRLAERVQNFQDLGFKESQLRNYEHHSCHAATAYYGCGRYDRPVLVITCDGAGDGLCATVSVGVDGVIERKYSVDWSHSIGIIYAVVTYMAGMQPDEHEYKIMGMAPYAHKARAEGIKEKLRNLFTWDSDGAPVWRRMSGVPHVMNIQPVLEQIFYEERFDAIMGGTQAFVEEMLCELVRRAIKTTGIRDVALSGGVFMNVKANKMIGELDDVDSLYVFPSCGDETNAIGALYLSQAAHNGYEAIPPMTSLYLGPEWSDEAILAVMRPAEEAGDIKIERPDDLIGAATDLLVQGEVVARFSGREEFGARSLGNRAILADPRNPEVIQVINEMIKSRDFWMPFACSMQDVCADKYLINPKQLDAPYMILSFDTTPEGSEAVKAGTHPYDKTCRPQVVTREANPSYWDLIDRFRQKTGVGGLLNTSLNLHGLPLVHKPDDALEVMMRSKLRYLAIGPFLITKSE